MIVKLVNITWLTVGSICDYSLVRNWSVGGQDFEVGPQVSEHRCGHCLLYPLLI